MKYWTLAEIRAKIVQECDLEDEDFVRSTELRDYINEAIDEAESEIHGLYEDYFLKQIDVPLTAGTELLSIPALMPDIYGEKIREIMFYTGDGTKVYEVKRLAESRKFAERAIFRTNVSTDLVQFYTRNQTPGNPEIVLVPKATESGFLEISYLRNANRLVLETDICDIPEFVSFVTAHAKVKVYEKEGHPGQQAAMVKLDRERERMVGTLAAKTPDGENKIEMDLSFYEDMN